MPDVVVGLGLGQEALHIQLVSPPAFAAIAVVALVAAV